MRQIIYPYFIKIILIALGLIFIGSITGIGYFIMNLEAKDKANLIMADRFNTGLDSTLYSLQLYFLNTQDKGGGDLYDSTVGEVKAFGSIFLDMRGINASAYNNLGLKYFSEGDYAGAEEYYLRAIELSPEFKNAYNNLGNAYALQDKFDKAETYYLKAIEQDSLYAKPHHNIGSLYMNRWFDDGSSRDDLLISKKWFEKAIELDDNWYMPQQSLGRAHLRLSDGNQDEIALAGKYLLRAIEIAPDEWISHFELGYVYYNQGLRDKAKEEWETAQSLGWSVYDANMAFQLLKEDQ